MIPSINLTALRHATWGGEDTENVIAFLGEDIRDASFSWAFAQSPGGPVLFTLEGAPAGEQGLSGDYDPSYTHPATGLLVGATIVVPQIDEVTLKGLSDPVPASSDIRLTHTFYAQRANSAKRAVFQGTFRIMQGAPN